MSCLFCIYAKEIIAGVVKFALLVFALVVVCTLTAKCTGSVCVSEMWMLY